MGAVAELFVDLGRIALGLTPFSMLLWAYVSVLLLVVGPTFAHISPRLVDPPARLIATDPVRVVLWMPLAFILLVALTIFLLITIFGAMLMPIIAVLLGLSGYVSLALLIGEATLRRVGVGVAPAALATMVGIFELRLVRLVPFVGAPAHSLLAWVGFAAASCMTTRAIWQWHRRRLPDAEQFRGETLIEWYPDGDPADGRPSPGTGRPVLENVRGEEDRTPPVDDE